MDPIWAYAKKDRFNNMAVGSGAYITKGLIHKVDTLFIMYVYYTQECSASVIDITDEDLSLVPRNFYLRYVRSYNVHSATNGIRNHWISVPKIDICNNGYVF